MEVVILSHRRAGLVKSHQHVAGCLVCVPEGQADEYKRQQPELKLVTHPDDILGGCLKRQWIYDNFGDVFLLDDDSVGMRRLYRQAGSTKCLKVSRETTRAIIEETADTCRQLGAFLFGFNSHMNPAAYVPYRPFSFGRYMAGAFGLLAGSKIKWPDTTLPLGDYWAFLQNAHYHRIAFIDSRFGFGFVKTYNARGGSAEYRNTNTEQECFEFLVRNFGDVVQPGSKTGISPKSVARNPFKRRVRLPYHV